MICENFLKFDFRFLNFRTYPPLPCHRRCVRRGISWLADRILQCLKKDSALRSYLWSTILFYWLYSHFILDLQNFNVEFCIQKQFSYTLKFDGQSAWWAWVVAVHSLHGCTSNCLPHSGEECYYYWQVVRKQSIRSVPHGASHSHHLTIQPSHLCMMAGWQGLEPVICTVEDCEVNRVIDTAVLDRQYCAQKLVQLEDALMLCLRTKFP
jgi:hypothetical protein